MGLRGLGEIAQQDALDDLRPMLIDDRHVRRRTYADFAQQRDRLFARQLELFCELMYSYG